MCADHDMFVSRLETTAEDLGIAFAALRTLILDWPAEQRDATYFRARMCAQDCRFVASILRERTEREKQVPA